MRGRIRYIKKFRDGLASLYGISRLMSVACLARFADGIEDRIVVRDATLRTHHRSSGPVRAEHPRFDRRNVNSKGLHFFSKRRRDAFESKLTAVIVREPRQRHQTTHGCDVQNATSPPCAHVRQNGLDHRNRAKNVYLELLPQLFHRAFFQSALVPITGIVDEGVDRTNVALDLLDRSGKLRCIIGHVEDSGNCGSRRHGFEFGRSFGPPYRTHNGETRFQQSGGKSLSKTAACSCYDDYPFHLSSIRYRRYRC